MIHRKVYLFVFLLKSFSNRHRSRRQTYYIWLIDDKKQIIVLYNISGCCNSDLVDFVTAAISENVLSVIGRKGNINRRGYRELVDSISILVDILIL